MMTTRDILSIRRYFKMILKMKNAWDLIVAKNFLCLWVEKNANSVWAHSVETVQMIMIIQLKNKLSKKDCVKNVILSWIN